MRTIWQRYFLIELLKLFILFIGSFYFLYVLIDYSAHAKAFHGSPTFLRDTTLYYAAQFTKRADILIPVALMVATIKVIATANIRNEIVALAAGGISLKKIVSPFLWAALFCATFLYLNFQFLQPLTLKRIAAFEERYFKIQQGMDKQVEALTLEDNSLLIYQSFDSEKGAFFDLFWLKNTDNFYRIESLYPYETVPKGKNVALFERNSLGEIVKLSSFDEKLFPEIRFDVKTLFSATHPPRMQSITQLASHMGTHFGMGKMSDREAEATACFYFKLTIPLICLFAVIGPLPYFLRFGRRLPLFLIFALSIFAMIAYFAVLNSAQILGESQVIPPFLAILMPQMIAFLILTWRYAKL